MSTFSLQELQVEETKKRKKIEITREKEKWGEENAELEKEKGCGGGVLVRMLS